MNDKVQVPKLEQVTAQLKDLIIQRAGLKDQIEMIEKQMPTLQGIAQVLQAQAEAVNTDD